MGRIRNITRGMAFPYNVRALLNPANFMRELTYERERRKRGWSSRDTWAGGEYIMEVSAGILRYLNSEKGHVDWEHYFSFNYEDNYGYTDLNGVAQDLENYLAWGEEQYQDPIFKEYDQDTRWAIEYQLYEQAKVAMHFVAENIGGLWD